MKNWPRGGGDKYLIALKPDLLKLIVRKTYSDLSPIKNTFQGIAFTGASGSLVAPIICYRLNKYPIYIRKKDPRCIGGFIEGAQVDTYIILDDFISYGTTARYMLRTLEPYCKCIGIYLYNQCGHKRTFDNIPVLQNLSQS